MSRRGPPLLTFWGSLTPWEIAGFGLLIPPPPSDSCRQRQQCSENPPLGRVTLLGLSGRWAAQWLARECQLTSVEALIGIRPRAVLRSLNFDLSTSPASGHSIALRQTCRNIGRFESQRQRQY